MIGKSLSGGFGKKRPYMQCWRIVRFHTWYLIGLEVARVDILLVQLGDPNSLTVHSPTAAYMPMMQLAVSLAGMHCFALCNTRPLHACQPGPRHTAHLGTEHVSMSRARHPR